MNAVLLALAGLGAVAVLRFVHSAVQFLTFHLLPPSRALVRYQRPGGGAWALVTGASAGIGLGIAQELVRQGFGVVLLGHVADELASAAASLRALRADARVRTLVLDARAASPAELQAAVDSLADLDVTVLVNNVGGNAVAVPPLRPHATYSCADVDAVVDQNARFMARLTALMLPVLARQRPAAGQNQKQSRCLILTLSSAAHVGVPYLITYGATKAFNRAFGFGLARELALDPATAHIDSLVVVPGEVLTQGNRRGVPAEAPRWDAFGRDVVRKAGAAVDRGWREMYPHWRHDLEWKAAQIAPEAAVTKGIVDQLTFKKVAWDEYFAKNQ